MKNLPLNGRSFDMLIALDPAVSNVTSTKASGAGAQFGNLFAVSGRHFGENLFLLNGIEYMGPSQVHSVPGGVSGQLLGVDAVREFNVVENTYGAEYGKRDGAKISIVTQSGTNQLHGTAFEFIRNSAMDAKSYFDHPLGERIPPFERNQFGGVLGGPIRRNKTFIFGNYEGFRQRLGVSDVAIVPDSNARLGLLPCGTITPLPAGCTTSTTTPTKVPNLNNGMLPYINACWPVPNRPELGGGTAENFSNPLQHIREDFGTVRVDNTFSDKDTLGVSYMVDNRFNSTPQPNPLWGQNTSIVSQVLSIQETHVFSPNVINTFTAGFSRASFLFLTPPITTTFPSNLIMVAGEFPGRVAIGGSGTGASSTITVAGAELASDQTSFRNQFTYSDGLQIIKGRNQFSTGVWFARLQSNEFAPKDQAGAGPFTTLESFLQGTVASFLATRSKPRFTGGNWRVPGTFRTPYR